ncbi:hypothetical protein AMK11_02300 [Streptomyces sp. CB02414]|nr:hypothetical protein AMK11_02300 [Streptomyces sp. CB02414]
MIPAVRLRSFRVVLHGGEHAEAGIPEPPRSAPGPGEEVDGTRSRHGAILAMERPQGTRVIWYLPRFSTQTGPTVVFLMASSSTE